MSDLFIVSVANAILRDPVSKAVIGRSTALADSTFTLAMESSEVRGGINNALRYNYKNTRTLTVTLTDTTFSNAYMPLNVGEEILNNAITIVADDCLELDEAGTATLAHTPTSIVSFSFGNNTILNKTLTDTAVNLGTAYANQKVYATYDYTGKIDNFSISTTKPPSTINLTLMAQVRDTNGTLVEWLHIEIPSFQIDGNYELSLTADGVSQQPLSGSALSVFGTKCNDGDVYAYVKFVPVDQTAISVAAIAGSPSPMTIAPNTTSQISVAGIRNGMSQNIDITADCVFAMQALSDSSISVVSSGTNAGLVTASGIAQAGDTGGVIITYQSDILSLTDTVNVVVETA